VRLANGDLYVRRNTGGPLNWGNPSFWGAGWSSFGNDP
jgi:hypothetical protein